MPAKEPKWDTQTLTGTPMGTIQTGEAVQTGCVMCLRDGLMAPAANHVAYLYQGTSYCGPHLIPYLPRAENA